MVAGDGNAPPSTWLMRPFGSTWTSRNKLATRRRIELLCPARQAGIITTILTSQKLVENQGIEPRGIPKEDRFTVCCSHQCCSFSMVLVLLTHYLLCSTGLLARLTVYVHSYSGMIKPMAYISKTNTTFNYTGMFDNNCHPTVNHVIVSRLVIIHITFLVVPAWPPYPHQRSTL